MLSLIMERKFEIFGIVALLSGLGGLYVYKKAVSKAKSQNPLKI